MTAADALPRGRHGLTREAVERSQRERLLDAAARVTAARGYEAPGDWVERCRQTLRALLGWFAADPPLGRFLLIEPATVGPEFHAIFQAGFDRLVAMIDDGLDEDIPDPQPLPATRLAVGAVISRVYGEVAAGRTARLPDLLPQLTYETLVPFLGEAAAREAARQS